MIFAGSGDPVDLRIGMVGSASPQGAASARAAPSSIRESESPHERRRQSVHHGVPKSAAVVTQRREAWDEFEPKNGHPTFLDTR
jgi:hypothetical protein